jgi:hypothetical protein
MPTTNPASRAKSKKAKPHKKTSRKKASSMSNSTDPFMASTDKDIGNYFNSESIERSDSDFDDYSDLPIIDNFSVYSFQVDAKKKECIDTCLHCAQTCNQMMNYCLKMGDEFAGQEHIAILSVCADLCNLTAKALSLDSEFENTMCELTIEVCERCAADCRELSESDENMQECADICQACAASCNEIIQ